jgi:hypothetical protein
MISLLPFLTVNMIASNRLRYRVSELDDCMYTVSKVQTGVTIV